MTEKHVVYRPVSNDIVFASFKRRDDSMMVMTGEPTDVTNDAITAVAENMLRMMEEGQSFVVDLNGRKYRLNIKEETE